MYSSTSLFVGLKMKMLHHRRRVRYGRAYEKRFEVDVVHHRFNLLVNAVHDTAAVRASELVLRLLLARHSERVLRKKVEYYGKCATLVQRCRLFENLSAIYRKAYLKRYLYKEMDFVATHYLKKNNRGGKQIYKNIMELDPLLVRRMMTLYLRLKQKGHLLRCYQECLAKLQGR